MSVPRSAVNEKEACKQLGMSRTTLYELRRAGKIGFYRSGRTIKYDRVLHLDAYLKRCERNSEVAGR